MLDALAASFWPRLEIWTNSILTWLDNPIFGSGLGTFETAYAPHRADHWTYFPEMGTVLQSLAVHAGAAHNEILQILVELGLIGAALIGWFLYCALKGTKSRARWCVWIAIAICLIEFPLQNPASAILIAVALGLSARPSPESSPSA